MPGATVGYGHKVFSAACLRLPVAFFFGTRPERLNHILRFSEMVTIVYPWIAGNVTNALVSFTI